MSRVELQLVHDYLWVYAGHVHMGLGKKSEFYQRMYIYLQTICSLDLILRFLLKSFSIKGTSFNSSTYGSSICGIGGF